MKNKIIRFLLKSLNVKTQCGECNHCQFAMNPYSENNPEGYFCELNMIATKDFTQATSFGCTEFQLKV